MLLGSALLSALLAASTPSCTGEQATLLPFEAHALPRAGARELEEAVRRALSRVPGACVAPRDATVARLRELGGPLAPCDAAPCARRQLEALGTQWVLRGTALGVGGQRTVSLVLSGPSGPVATRAVSLEEGTHALEAGVAALWQGRGLPARAAQVQRSAWPRVLLGVGGAALAGGVGLALLSRRTEARAETPGACTGEGEAFRACIAGQLSTGRKQTRAANVLLGAGALLGAGGGLWLVWELP